MNRSLPPRLSVHIWPLAAVALTAGLTLSSEFTERIDRQVDPATRSAIVTIGATMTDALIVDDDNDNMADPDDTLRYTVVITNSGDEPAMGVSFDNTLDANTTLVPGSIETTPLARPDSFESLANIGIDVPAGSGLLANDSDPDGSGLAATPITAFDNPSTGGGAVSVNTADGSFTYTPTAGFEGTDTFTYTIDDDEGNFDVGTVIIEVANEIWFIDNTGGGSGGSGTLADPFKTITDFNNSAGPGAGDFIYIAETGSAYITGINLQANQVFVGEGAVGADLAAVLGIMPPPNSVTLPPINGAPPTITSTAGNGINLSSGNTVRGLTVGNTTGIGISGAAVGTFTASDVSVTGLGEAIDIDGGTLAATLLSLSSSGSANQGIDLNNVAGSLTVSALSTLSSISGNGIDITNSTATISFNGGASVSTTGAGSVGINLSGGTVNVSGGTNTVNASTGTAINAVNTDLGAGGWTFSTVSSSGGAGVNLENVSGTFNGTGGAISSGAGTGFRVHQGSSDVSYAGTITNTSGNSVVVTSRTGGTVTVSGSITDSGLGISLNGNTGASIAFSDSLDLDTGANTAFSATGGGTVSATGAGSTINNTTGVGVNIANTTIGAAGVTFQSISVNGAPNGIVLNSTGTTGGLTVTGDGIDVSLGGNDSGGLLQSTTGDAVDLDNAANVSLTSMEIRNPVGAGIHALELQGSNSLTNFEITGVNQDSNGVRIRNVSSTLADFFVQNSKFTNSTTGSTMFLVEGGGAIGLTMQVRVDGSEFSGLDPTAYQHTAGLQSGDNPTVRTFFTNNDVENAGALTGSSEVNLLMGHSGHSAFVVEDNVFDHVGLVGLNSGILNVGGNSAMNGGSVTGRIHGNDFSDLPGRTNALRVVMEPVSGSPGTVDVTIDENRFDDLLDVINDAIAILVDMRENVPLSHVRITNNSIGQGLIPGTTAGNIGGSADGVFIQVDDAFANTMNLLFSNNSISVTNDLTSGDPVLGDQLVIINADDNLAEINATVADNTFNNAGTGEVVIRSDAAVSSVCLDLVDNDGNRDVNVIRDAGATFLTEGTSGDNATVAAFFNGQNTVNVVVDGDGGGGFGLSGGCPEPPSAPSITPTLTEQVVPPVEHEVDRQELSGDDLIDGGLQTGSDEVALDLDLALNPVPDLIATVSHDSRAAVANVSLPIGELPAGKSITVTFDAGVNSDANTLEVCNQGTVSGSNFSTVATDDPDVGGSADPTCTALDVALPVELAEFEATVDQTRVQLTWVTASETNNAGFHVQHACVTCQELREDLAVGDEIRDWTTLDFVDGHGTTSEPVTYQFLTGELDPGRHAFRLKQTDFDGTFEYGPVVEVTVEIPGQFVLEQAYPNPFNPSATIRFGLATRQHATLRMFDLSGREVRRLFDGVPESGSLKSVRIDAAGLASGTYLVRLETEGFAESRTVVLLK